MRARPGLWGEGLGNDPSYPAVSDAYFTYASRGCVRKCAFCGVPTLEGMQRDTNSLTEVVEGVSKLYGEKRDLIVIIR